MTLILNVLHRDMSILAADQKAIVISPIIDKPDITEDVPGSPIVDNYRKITLNTSANLALGIAGNTQDHYYTPEIELSASADEVLYKIRKHINSFLRIHDRTGLSTLNSFMVNQGIASFFDPEVGTFFTNTYLFSPIESQTRLHRAADEVKIFHAGSGSEYFQKEFGVDIDSFIAAVKNSCTPEACIYWMKETYRRISASNAGTGSEAVFVVSTRTNYRFCSIEG